MIANQETAKPIQRPARQMELAATYEWKLPLMSIDTVRGILAVSEDDVLGMITDGTLRWAWDLRGNGSERAFVRIWEPAVRVAQRLLRGEKAEPDTRQHALIVFSIFKHARPVLRATEIQRAWHCGSDHVNDLIRQGLLWTVRPKASYQCNEAAVVIRSSLEKFMEERRMA